MPTRMHKEGSSHTMIDAFRARADELGPTRPPGDSAPTTTSPRVPTATAWSRRPSPAPRRATGRPSASSTCSYADNVYGYVRSIVRDDYEAEDVTQHVFAKLMTVLAEVRAARRAVLRLDPPGRAQRRGRPHARRAARSRARRSASSTSARTTATRSRRSIALREALATLPEEQREVIVLRHLVGLTPGEIAGRLGKTEPSIHGLHHRGRGALRAALAERECAPTVAHQGGRVTRTATATHHHPAAPARPGRPARCSRSCSRSSPASPRHGRVHHGRTSSRPSRPSSPPTARPTTRSASPPAPRRSSLALRALGIGPGDEVIVPANSFIATAEAVSLAGATPEARRRRPGHAPADRRGSSQAAIGPRTRAVIPVHLMGSTVDMAADHGRRPRRRACA